MRTQKEIKKIRIFTTTLKSGWVTEIEYKDGKCATFSVDYGKDRSFDMLAATLKSIERQLDGK